MSKRRIYRYVYKANPTPVNAVRLAIYGICLILLLTGAAAFADQPEESIKQLITRFQLQESDVATRDLDGWRKPQKVVVMGADQDVVDLLSQQVPDASVIKEGWFLSKEKNYSDVDVVIGPCNPNTLGNATNARWVHATAAGVDACATLDPVRTGRVVVTNSQRIFGPQVADHALALTLALSRGLDRFANSQANGEWKYAGPLVELEGKTMLIVGLGGIGTEIARRAKAFGMRVTATRNSSRRGPSYVDYVGLADELFKLSADADVVVNALPLTNNTRHLFDRSFFAGMKPTAYFVNIGRGESVVTEALRVALVNGHIAGAAVDVVDPEPLPPDHALWRTPNLIITPHQAGRSAEADARRWAIAAENLRRYAAGEPLLSVVDAKRSY